MAEQLALIPADASTATTVSELFSVPEWRALNAKFSSSKEAVAAIRGNPALHAACSANLDALEAAARPGGHEAVEAVLGRLAIVYGSPWESDQAQHLAKAAYHEALDDLPAEALRLGVRDYDRQPDAKFFPRPGPFRALCAPHAGALQMIAHRAREATRIAGEVRQPTRVVETPEERARGAALFREFTAAMKSGRRLGTAKPETPEERATRLEALREVIRRQDAARDGVPVVEAVAKGSPVETPAAMAARVRAAAAAAAVSRPQAEAAPDFV